MLAKRIIPCLDIDKGRVVKGVNFVNLVDAGDPVQVAKAYDKIGADEIVFLDITASSDGRKTALWCKVVENTLTTFRWEIEYRVIELFYFRHKSRAKICYMLGISERTFTYWTERITDCAYQWACELGLL